MSTTPATVRPIPRARRDWLSQIFGALLVVVTGVVLGQQYWAPNKRVLPVLVGLLLLGLAFRVGMISGLGVLLIALPYPRGTVFGNTNLALILILLVIWLLRVTTRQSPMPRRTPADIPIVGLFIAYVVSFYNVPDTWYLVRAFQNFELFIGCILMFYLIVNNTRSERDLERMQYFQLFSALSIFLVAIYELNHPGAPFIQGWLDFSNTVGTEFNSKNIRVGATFHDYELLSEYCVITLLMVVFLWIRARSPVRKALLTAMLLLNVFIMFATVTRGAIVSLSVGLVVLLFLTRRHLKVVPFTIVAVTGIVLFLTMNFYVAHFTRSGDMFARLQETRVVNGWMPEARANAWENGFARAMVHPLIGQGPFYWELPGYQLWWPHNVYLFYWNILGLVGLTFYVSLLVTIFRLVWPKVDDLSHPNYARAYQVVCFTQLVVFVVNEFKIDYLRNPIYQFPVWAMFSMMVATSLIARESAQTETAPAPAARVAFATPARLLRSGRT